MEIIKIKTPSIDIKADPTQLLEYVFYIKAQMKCLEEDLKEKEELVMALLDAKGGKIDMVTEDVIGKAFICSVKNYEYSDEINQLTEEIKKLEDKIKIKKIIEMVDGAKIKSVKRHVRYNVEFK